VGLMTVTPEAAGPSSHARVHTASFGEIPPKLLAEADSSPVDSANYLQFK
jgi:hypothetical protein